MKDIISITDLDNSDFIIKWRMTEMCNADCSYCIRKKQARGSYFRTAQRTEQASLRGCEGNFKND